MENAIAKVNYTHDALIDAILRNPAAKQGDLARVFGYTQAWLSRVMSSDAFKDRLAARRADLIDPGIITSIEHNMEALARQSIALLQDKLETSQNPELAIKALDISTKAMGFGARGAPGVQVNAGVVVLMPAKAKDASAWVEEHAPIDLVPLGHRPTCGEVEPTTGAAPDE